MDIKGTHGTEDYGASEEELVICFEVAVADAGVIGLSEQRKVDARDVESQARGCHSRGTTRGTKRARTRTRTRTGTVTGATNAEIGGRETSG